MSTKKRKVLEEEDYLEQVNQIIVRDFYPELPKLKKQLAILESENVLRYSSILNQTPNTTLERLNKLTEDDLEETESLKESKKLSLDQFHAVHTSEDNESFEQVLKQKQEEEAAKFRWLFDLEKKENNNTLLLTNGDEDKQPTSLLTWNYKARNELMYDPEGKSLTAEELKQFKGPPKEIKHENTRFQDDPFKKPLITPPPRGETKSKETLFRNRGVDTSKKVILADLHDTLQERNALLSSVDINTNNNSSYPLLSTPSITPSDSSPVMTWGTISTPHLLDPSFTPEREGTQYKIPSTPIREQILFDLDRKSNKKTKMEKNKSKEFAARLRSPSSRSPSSPFRLNSPALHRINSPAISRLSSPAWSSFSSPTLSSSSSPSLSIKSSPSVFSPAFSSSTSVSPSQSPKVNRK